MVASMADGDSHNLGRFVEAQDRPATCRNCADMSEFECASHELTRHAKTCHWIWFIFPQIDGLGGSAMSKDFAIRTLDEARAYASHRLLRDRYIRVVELVRESLRSGTPPTKLMGSTTDVRKLASSLTLFREVASLQGDEDLVAVSGDCLELLEAKCTKACDMTLAWIRNQHHD